MLDWLKRLFSSTAAEPAQNTPTKRVCLTNSGNDHAWFDIVGEASYQDTLRRIAGNRLLGRQKYWEPEPVSINALVIPEPTNSHDPNAVRVDAEGFGTVGYFKREDAGGFFLDIVAWMRGAAVIGECRGALTGGWEADKHIGVRLALESPYHLRTRGIGPEMPPRRGQVTTCCDPNWQSKPRVQIPLHPSKPRPLSDEYAFQSTLRALVVDRDPAEETIAFAAILVPDPTNPAGADTVIVCADELGPVGRLGTRDVKKHAAFFSGLHASGRVGQSEGWVVLEGDRLGAKVLLEELAVGP